MPSREQFNEPHCREILLIIIIIELKIQKVKMFTNEISKITLLIFQCVKISDLLLNTII